jgi:hypothetical protein
MSQYTVKLGEVYVKADRPITTEDRERVITVMDRRGRTVILIVDDMEVHVTLRR